MSSEAPAASSFLLVQPRSRAWNTAAGAPAITHISGIKKGKRESKRLKPDKFFFFLKGFLGSFPQQLHCIGQAVLYRDLIERGT